MNTPKFTLCVLVAAFLAALPLAAVAACDARSGRVLQALSARHRAGS